MDTSINTRPLLQRSDTDSEFDEDPNAVHSESVEDDVVKDSRPLFNSWQPSDRYNVAFIIFYILGTIILLPWFFFITAEDYWMYKFRALKDNVTLTESGRTELQTSFTSYMSVAATIPSTIFLIINPLINHRIPLGLRTIGSLVAMLILFIVTTVFVKVNTDGWQYQFFQLTLAIIVVLNIASAILQSAIFGVAGKFPSKYIAGTVSGQALGGIMAAVAEIVSLSVGASPTLSAMVYFIMADVFIFISILGYIYLSSTTFFKYYSKELPRSGSIQYEPVSSIDKESTVPVEINYFGILKKIFMPGVALWFCFVVTFSVYPSVTVLIKSTLPTSRWTEVYFVPVVTFFIYSVCDYVGRIISAYLQWPEKKTWIMVLISVARVVFIPLILLCNAQPRHHLPVIIDSDWYYISIIILFGLTNGYLANITFIVVPKLVASHEQEVGSSMLAAFLGIGIACGSGIGLLTVKLV